MIRTPAPRLFWCDLAGWCQAAWILDRRNASAARHEAIAAHLAALPLDLVRRCDDADALHAALYLWRHGPNGFKQPHRGQRATALQTPLIVAAENRLAQLRRAAAADDIPAGPNWRAMHAGPAVTGGEARP